MSEKETEVQRHAYIGFERLALGRYDEALDVVFSLMNNGKEESGKEKNIWLVYAGLLGHCLLCWRPNMRDAFDTIDVNAAEILLQLSYDEQEEFFMFSQRLEDNADNRIAGLGMYLHYALLEATNDHEHAIPVIEDSIELHEPLSSTIVAFEMLNDEKKKSNEKQIKELLEVGIGELQPFAFECALLDQCKSMFEQDVLRVQLVQLNEKNSTKTKTVLSERSLMLSVAKDSPEDSSSDFDFLSLFD